MPAWESSVLFGKVFAKEVRLSLHEREEFRQFLWKDLCAEFDSCHLYREILKRQPIFHEEFLQFIREWRADEENHTVGFARIYEILFGESVSSLQERLAERPSDFSHLGEYLEDEFKLLCLLAYDELATTFTYHKDVGFYEGFGPACFREWIQRLKKDEAKHFAKAMRLLRKYHAHRFQEVPSLMRELLALDLNQTEYKATFVLDHSPDCSHFQLDATELTEMCAHRIVRMLTPTA